VKKQIDAFSFVWFKAHMSHNVKKFAKFSFIISWAVIALLFLCGVKIVKN